MHVKGGAFGRCAIRDAEEDEAVSDTVYLFLLLASYTVAIFLAGVLIERRRPYREEVPF